MSEQRKWTSRAGPRQTKAADKALRAMSWEGPSRDEITGTIGGAESRSTLTDVFGQARPDFDELYAGLGERFGWTITRDNCREIVAAVEEATARLAESRPVDDKRATAEERAERDKATEAQQQKYADAEQARRESHAAIMAKRPAWAKVLIVAELDECQSDPMTDYFAHGTTREVAIGWRKSSREDFRALRQAAATFPETAHLGPGCDDHTVRIFDSEERRTGLGLRGDDGCDRHFNTEAEAEEAAKAYAAENPTECRFGWRIDKESVEHRDNWSMGSGNYLKRGYTHRSGWRVRSYSLPLYASAGPFEDHLPEPEAAGYAGRKFNRDHARMMQAVDSVTVTENDDKDGVEIRFPQRPADDVLARLKANGWRWSRRQRCWYHRRTEEARAFADVLAG